MRWGLVPWWWKKPPKELPGFNARAENVPTSQCSAMPSSVIAASSRQPILRVTQEAGRSAAVFHQPRGRRRAQFRDRWKNPETGEPVISCTVIVTDANELTRAIHDRMPVVLDQADIGRWLNERGLLRPAAEDRCVRGHFQARQQDRQRR